MTLYEKLQQAKSEEDVKDIYIKALGLTSYQKGLIDIQTKEIWFEAKQGSKLSSYAMFTQLLHYVQVALDHGETLPPFLAVIDTEKAALMKTSDALPLLEKRTIKWGKSASDVTKDALDAVSAYIGTYFVSFRIKTHEHEFIETIKNAIKNHDIIRTQITPANLKQVFDKWVEMIGKEISGVTEQDYALLFYADIMHDGTVSTHKNLPAEFLYRDGQPVFFLGGKLYELGSKEGYRRFWAIYHRPPREEYRNHMLEHRHLLIPIDEQAFKGAFYTPLHVVDKAYEKLSEVLGENWQEEYIVWDMCCGVGNLEVKHSNPRNVFMSTLDEEDLKIMHSTNTCVGATRFQYDYLNDDITDDGQIDYNLSNKVPENLRKAIRSGKKILVLINPPYAESGEGGGLGNKAGVAKTKFAATAMKEYGKATNELFTQFVVRFARELPNATLAMFSTLKYVNATNFEEFRKRWDAEYLGGFVVPSKSFEGIKGDFPIGFLVWQTSHGDGTLSQIGEISVEVLDKEAKPIGEKKFFNLNETDYLSRWIERPKSEGDKRIPLSNAVTVSHSKSVTGVWRHDAIAHFVCDSNDFQNSAKYTTLLSSSQGIGHKGAIFVLPENLWQIACMFTVRRIIKPTWLNDRDQFLQPTGELTEEFRNDCLVWMLFNGSNLTASANDLEWNGKKWSIVNHFIPYTEVEVGAPERFESDFMVRYMAGKAFSPEAKAVLDAGRELWLEYYKHTDPHTVREELKLNRSDVGWYQIRKALEARNKSGDYQQFSDAHFKTAYNALTEKIRPQVYSLGFLRE